MNNPDILTYLDDEQSENMLHALETITNQEYCETSLYHSGIINLKYVWDVAVNDIAPLYEQIQIIRTTLA